MPRAARADLRALAVEADRGRSRDALEAIRAGMERAVAVDDAQAFLASNVAYHRCLALPCPNGLLRELVELTWNRSLRYQSLLVRLPRYVHDSLARHGELHAAVAAGDAAAAAEADRAILERAREQILLNIEGAVVR